MKTFKKLIIISVAFNLISITFCMDTEKKEQKRRYDTEELQRIRKTSQGAPLSPETQRALLMMQKEITKGKEER